MAKKKESESKVVIFGEEVGERGGRERGEGDVGFGVVLIFAGVILLMNSLGVVPWEVWQWLWRLWPVLIILAGLNLVVNRSGVLRGLVALAGLVLMGSLAFYIVGKYVPEAVSWMPEELRVKISQWEGVEQWLDQE